MLYSLGWRSKRTAFFKEPEAKIIILDTNNVSGLTVSCDTAIGSYHVYTITSNTFYF